MQLSWLEARLIRRLNLAELHLANFLQHTSVPFDSARDIYELEGWLSDVWQVWCRFCRRTIFASCNGCETTSGIFVVPSQPSPEVVSFIAARQKFGKPPSTLGVNTRLHLEPTWGHVDRLIEVIQALAPANRVKLLSAFSIIPSIEHVRLIRNATAHRNVQSFSEVLAFQSQYLAIPVRHPLEALFWVDPSTGRTLMHSRLDDMRICAKNACA